MPFILDLSGHDEPSAQDSAVQARILAEQAVSIVRRYGPGAVLDATADALTFYLAQVQPFESAGTRAGYEAVTDVIRQLRQARESLKQEAIEYLNRL